MTKPVEYYLRLNYPIELRRSPDGGYFATHPDLPGCMAEGASPEETLTNLADSRELWVEARITNGYAVPEPLSDDEPSGRISLRMLPSLHAQLAKIAARKDISINLLLNTVLAQYAGAVAVENEIAPIVENLTTVATDLKSIFRGPLTNERVFAQAATSSDTAAVTQVARVLPFTKGAAEA